MLDVHWYPEARGWLCDSVGGYYKARITTDSWAAPSGCTGTSTLHQARMAAPRSLWDPTYSEDSWIQLDVGGPIRLIPRLKDVVASKYPGTAIAITEYYYGGAGYISGAVAQADLLGIFGREGVFAANFWPNARTSQYTVPSAAYACALPAFQVYLDYDGAGSGFGDLSALTTGGDAARASAFASVRSADDGKVIVVAINKSTVSLTASLRIRHTGTLTDARLFRLGPYGAWTDPGCTGPSAAGTAIVPFVNALVVSLPATSVTVVELR